MSNMSIKNCPECGHDKMSFEFYKKTTSFDGLYTICKECTKARSNTPELRAKRRDYYRNNVNGFRDAAIASSRARTPEQRREWQLRGKYGITPAEFEAILSLQEGRCAICRTDSPVTKLWPEAPSRGWHIDHDHITNTIRGILCGTCNIGLGYYKDSPALLEAASNYLKPRGRVAGIAAGLV